MVSVTNLQIKLAIQIYFIHSFTILVHSADITPENVNQIFLDGMSVSIFYFIAQT